MRASNDFSAHHQTVRERGFLSQLCSQIRALDARGESERDIISATQASVRLSAVSFHRDDIAAFLQRADGYFEEHADPPVKKYSAIVRTALEAAFTEKSQYVLSEAEQLEASMRQSLASAQERRNLRTLGR